MKKYISLILLFLLSSLVSMGQQPGETKWKENIAKNRIQSQTQWNHKYQKGKPVRKGYKNFSKKFDYNGNVIEEIYYKSGSVDQKLSYKYDNKDNKVEFVNYNGKEDAIMFKQNITYDNNNRKIREERYDGIDYQIIKYTYSKDNKLAKIVRSDIFGDVQHKREFEYTGNICNVTIYNKGKDPVGKIVNTYDDNENIIETVEYNDTGGIKEKYLYIFDNNLVRKKTKYIGSNFIYEETYKYDTKNNLIEIKKEQPKGKSIISNKYIYDKNNNLIEEQWYDNNPEYSKKTYHYDNDGLLEQVDVYYSLYKYRIQYRYDYKD